jgi:hypothetical protein
MDPTLGQHLINIREKIVSHLNSGNWEEIGLLSESSKIINSHPRLLRSLSWGDEDYAGNVLKVLRQIVEHDPKALRVIESYLDRNFPGDSHYISSKPSERKITFAPNVFQVPEGDVQLNLVAVMMPFAADLRPVYDVIRRACAGNDLECLRVDDIWEESAIIQDIFNLIFRAQVVVVDFTGKNPNVMYETGIAHTLGKHVIPISQSLADMPFDMQHHRVLKYHPNREGLATLGEELQRKLNQFRVNTDDGDLSF